MKLSEFYLTAGVTQTMSFAGEVELTFDPFEHQYTGVRFSADNHRFGLFDEPGTGKTVQAQAAGMLWGFMGVRNVVVMPPVLLPQFRDSFKEKFVGADKFFKVHLLRQEPKERAELFDRWGKEEPPQFLCMSYAMYIRVTPQLKSLGYRMVTADEAHALKNESSAANKATHALLGDGYDDGVFLPMTGTPIPNTIEDAHGIINLLHPGKYYSKKSFMRLHGEYIGHGFDKKLIGYKNLDRLAENLYQHARRVRKKDVFPNMEEAQVQVMSVELSPAHRKLYRKLLDERFLEFKGKILDATSQQKLRQTALQLVTTPGAYSDTEMPNAVQEMVLTLMDSLGVRKTKEPVHGKLEKIVVVANFRQSVEAIAHWLADYSPVTMYGGNSVTANDKNKRRFIEDPSCRALVINPESGGVGVDGLQKVCHYMIFAEPVSVPGDFKQAVDRLARSGQEDVVLVYILKTLGTAAVRAISNMLRKELVAAFLNDDREHFLRELFGDDEIPIVP